MRRTDARQMPGAIGQPDGLSSSGCKRRPSSSWSTGAVPSESNTAPACKSGDARSTQCESRGLPPVTDRPDVMSRCHHFTVSALLQRLPVLLPTANPGASGPGATPHANPGRPAQRSRLKIVRPGCRGAELGVETQLRDRRASAMAHPQREKIYGVCTPAHIEVLDERVYASKTWRFSCGSSHNDQQRAHGEQGQDSGHPVGSVRPAETATDASPTIAGRGGMVISTVGKSALPDWFSRRPLEWPTVHDLESSA